MHHLFRIAFLLVPLAGAAGCGNMDASYTATRGQLASPPIGRLEALELRRVWSGSTANLYPSSPSPDGRSISEIDWDTGDLAVIDLEAGRMRRVTDKGPWTKSPDFAEFSVFSPDGERIAYTWFNGKVGGYEIRSIRPDGSDMRVLIPHEEDVTYIAAADWSSDGRSILVTALRADRTSQIGVVSVSDGSYRQLKTTDWRHPSVSAFSPDGRYVAYDLPSDAKDPDQRDIFLLATAGGGGEVALVTGAADDRLLGWLPDGAGILYHSRTPESRTIWALRVENGEPVGKPQLVRPDVWQIHPFGFSRNALFYGVDVERPQIHVASVDLASGLVLTQPAPIGDPSEGRGHDVAWSPDGRSVAYLTERGGFRGARLVIRSVTGELQRQIAVPLSNPRKTQWTPDGAAVLMYGVDDEGRGGIHRIELRTGGAKPLLTHSPSNEEAMFFYALSPDGRTLYRRRAKGRPFWTVDQEIVAHDLERGESKVLLRVPPGRMLSVSPDGKWLAYTTENLERQEFGIMVVSTKGGEPRLIHRPVFPKQANRGALAWAPDGRSLVFHDVTSDGATGVWQLSLDGGSPRLLLDTKRLSPMSSSEDRPFPADLRLSPDGRHLAFESGRSRQEIWMMSGFAPAARRAEPPAPAAN
jgi:Tol biopolymer transport system component